MQNKTNIHIEQARHSRISEVDFDRLEFGLMPTDHMLVAKYEAGRWGEVRIEPFRDLQLSPFTLVLHYAQTIFEGLKAFRMEDGNICLFRPEENWARMNRSAERMCLPKLPLALFMEGLDALVRLDHTWVPTGKDKALYIRPVLFASEARLGVKAAEECLFLIVCSPVPEIYPEALKVRVETHYARAARGGTGAAKCGGNYAAALYPTLLAKEAGFDQVLWTDARQHEFVEESGTMNVAFVVDDSLFTPPLSDSILPGITRDAILRLAPDVGLTVREEGVSLDRLKRWIESGRLKEAFGMGTAAVVAPFQAISMEGEAYAVDTPEKGYAQKLKKRLNDIRYGRQEDPHGWNYIIEVKNGNGK